MLTHPLRMQGGAGQPGHGHFQSYAVATIYTTTFRFEAAHEHAENIQKKDHKFKKYIILQMIAEPLSAST